MSRYGRTLFDGRVMAASLDHAMWFHRPFRADEWLLYSQDSPSAQGGRGLARGSIFKPDGTLVASVAQEGSLREKRTDLKPHPEWQSNLPGGISGRVQWKSAYTSQF